MCSTKRTRLVEQTEAHVVVRLVLLLDGLLLLGLGRGTSIGSGSDGRSGGKGLGVGDSFLDLRRNCRLAFCPGEGKMRGKARVRIIDFLRPCRANQRATLEFSV
jgi:hypothetical protein